MDANQTHGGDRCAMCTNTSGCSVQSRAAPGRSVADRPRVWQWAHQATTERKRFHQLVTSEPCNVTTPNAAASEMANSFSGVWVGTVWGTSGRGVLWS